MYSHFNDRILKDGRHLGESRVVAGYSGTTFQPAMGSFFFRSVPEPSIIALMLTVLPGLGIDRKNRN